MSRMTAFLRFPRAAAWPSCSCTSTYTKTATCKTVATSGLRNRLLKTRWFVDDEGLRLCTITRWLPCVFFLFWTMDHRTRLVLSFDSNFRRGLPFPGKMSQARTKFPGSLTCWRRSIRWSSHVMPGDTEHRAKMTTTLTRIWLKLASYQPYKHLAKWKVVFWQTPEFFKAVCGGFPSLNEQMSGQKHVFSLNV